MVPEYFLFDDRGVKMKFLLAIFTVATCAAGCVVVTYGPLPESGPIGEYPASAVPFDIAALKVGWRQRIQIIKASGRFPIIDIERNGGCRIFAYRP